MPADGPALDAAGHFAGAAVAGPSRDAGLQPIVPGTSCGPGGEDPWVAADPWSAAAHSQLPVTQLSLTEEPAVASPEYATAKIEEKLQRAMPGPHQIEGLHEPRPRLLEVLWRVYYESGGPKVVYGHSNAPGQGPVEEVSIPVQCIYFSHDQISDIFTNGEHAGASVSALINDLNSGTVDPSDARLRLTLVRFNGELVSLNNRRLYALREHQRQKSGAMVVRARVRVLPLDPVTAKFVLAYTTRNGGADVAVVSGAHG